MRFSRLELIRYGHFEGCALAFEKQQPDFHIVYGANEAGKTTTMAAVTDLLFGFRRSTPYDFLHDRSLLRIGAVIEHHGGGEKAIAIPCSIPMTSRFPTAC